MSKLTQREIDLRKMREAQAHARPDGTDRRKVLRVPDAELADRRAAAAERVVRPPDVGGRDILLKGVTVVMLERLELKRRELGLRSRAETIRALLEEGLK